MTETKFEVQLIFSTPPNIGSGGQEGTLADRGFIKARDGWPYIPATALKGRLRHAVERVARGLGEQVCDTHHKMCRERAEACPVCRVFGSPWLPGPLHFADLTLSGPTVLVELRKKQQHPQYARRYGVGINRRRRVAGDQLLYTTELFKPGVEVTFAGTLHGPLSMEEAAWVVAGFNMLPHMGSAKSTGLGWLTAEVTVHQDGQAVKVDTLRQALGGSQDPEEVTP
jgi:CRISPR/Cas system CSM-associated protein Csm3 (group 7 of RAMP superfamily)